MEFEQMLADAEEAPGGEDSVKGAEDEGAEPPAEPPVRRKAKTKIGNKTKKKKKTKTTSKFPDGEESLQVELGNSRLVRSLFSKKMCQRKTIALVIRASIIFARITFFNFHIYLFEAWRTHYPSLLGSA